MVNVLAHLVVLNVKPVKVTLTTVYNVLKTPTETKKLLQNVNVMLDIMMKEKKTVKSVDINVLNVKKEVNVLIVNQTETKLQLVTVKLDGMKMVKFVKNVTTNVPLVSMMTKNVLNVTTKNKENYQNVNVHTEPMTSMPKKVTKNHCLMNVELVPSNVKLAKTKVTNVTNVLETELNQANVVALTVI
jgi:hypothetical protein